MFWTLAMILLVLSFATQGFIQVVIFLAVAGILIGVARNQSLRRRRAAVTVGGRKPR
jgi:hypothetical protein